MQQILLINPKDIINSKKSTQLINKAKDILARDPSDFDAHYIMGLCYLIQNNKNASRYYLSKTYVIEPSDEVRLILEKIKGDPSKINTYKIKYTLFNHIGVISIYLILIGLFLLIASRAN